MTGWASPALCMALLAPVAAQPEAPSTHEPYPSTYQAPPSDPVLFVNATILDGAGGRLVCPPGIRASAISQWNTIRTPVSAWTIQKAAVPRLIQRWMRTAVGRRLTVTVPSA
jgi:hypothetical protein